MTLRPASAALLLVTAALLTQGCGKSDDGATTTKTSAGPAAETSTSKTGGSPTDPRETVRIYLTALTAGDGAKSCDQFTDSLRGKVVTHFSRTYPKERFASCTDAVEYLTTTVAKIPKDLPASKIRIASRSSTTARVAVRDQGDARLAKVGGRWLIAEGLIPIS